jgi:alkylhydroperoxidase family enzyme
MDDSDVDALRSAGWDDAGVYEATAIVSLYNMTGRMEAASGLPEDRIPDHIGFPEAIG